MKLTSIVLASIVAEKLEIEQLKLRLDQSTMEKSLARRKLQTQECDDGFTMVTPKGSSRKNLCIDHKNGPKWDKNMPSASLAPMRHLKRSLQRLQHRMQDKRHKKDCTVTCSDKKNRYFPSERKKPRQSVFAIKKPKHVHGNRKTQRCCARKNEHTSKIT